MNGSILTPSESNPTTPLSQFAGRYLSPSRDGWQTRHDHVGTAQRAPGGPRETLDLRVHSEVASAFEAIRDSDEVHGPGGVGSRIEPFEGLEGEVGLLPEGRKFDLVTSKWD
jgi:hypothetical protein